MITIQKLKTLGKKTALRKAVLLLKQMELDSPGGIPIDRDYLADLVSLVGDMAAKDPATGSAADHLAEALSESCSEESLVRRINTLRYALQGFLGVSSGDWDFYDRGAGALNPEVRRVFPFRVYLDDIRSPFNVGSIFRTADSFGIEKILLSPHTADPLHSRAVRTSMGCTESVGWERMPPEELTEETGVFALELGGKAIGDFRFPREGIVVIGSEELGVGPEALAAADKGFGRVCIPLHGTKGSLNVSVAFGILMHTWYSSRAGEA